MTNTIEELKKEKEKLLSQYDDFTNYIDDYYQRE